MSRTILWDCHMHSCFSGDCETEMEKMADRALSLGLTGITFTEHLDPDYPPIPEDVDFSLDLDAYFDKFSEIKARYRGRLALRFGIELGLQPHLAKNFTALLGQYPFDFCIGSSHVVHGKDPYYPDFFEGKSEEACYREYFASIQENLLAFSGMDVYGHLDYIVRYGPAKNRFFSYPDYSDILDPILTQLIGKGIGLELNTGGFSYGLGEPNPCRDILKRYRELGGEILTIGSDAHKPERIAEGFDRAKGILTSCGFSHYTVFRGRKPEFLPL